MQTQRVRRQILTSLLAALATAACSRIPGNVIEPEDMAQLLADIHIGEGVTDQSGDFRSDSMRRVLKQSIYARHGVNSEKVDTSMIWYGRHLDEYQKVYDRTIEILEEKYADATANAVGAAMAIAGDSVDVWNLSGHLSIAGVDRPQYFTFSLESDENWNPGDAYTWKFKTINNADPVGMRIMVDYNDGFTEVTTSSTADDGWHNVQLSLDSTRTANRIYGVATFHVNPDNHLYVDSISLVRKRVNPIAYSLRYRQRSYGVKPRIINVPAPTPISDSLATKRQRPSTPPSH
ncbi:MAG: DUF4296 domain-containing protein [Muribaculaceae bacterium]|nr:DUF4296 domain-containing protein [Muribaculaceae bacterium]